MTCHRYIELNPVRAGMVGHPRAYPWSSYGCNAEGKSDALITPHEEYRRLGQQTVGAGAKPTAHCSRRIWIRGELQRSV